MTAQESFKRRIRARMERTGERYTTARRALLDRAGGRSRHWVSEPETSDEAVRAATGRGWDEWCDVIESWTGWDEGHTAVATHVRDELGVDAWWSQTVTVGWERITGRRLPYQRSDGTFATSRTRTVAADAELLRRLLLDDDDRRDLFGGLDVALRSRPDSKAVRLGLDSGRAVVGLEPRDDGRTRVSVEHEQLQTSEDVDRWRFWWGEWLEALDDPE